MHLKTVAEGENLLSPLRNASAAHVTKLCLSLLLILVLPSFDLHSSCKKPFLLLSSSGRLSDFAFLRFATYGEIPLRGPGRHQTTLVPPLIAHYLREAQDASGVFLL